MGVLGERERGGGEGWHGKTLKPHTANCDMSLVDSPLDAIAWCEYKDYRPSLSPMPPLLNPPSEISHLLTTVLLQALSDWTYASLLPTFGISVVQAAAQVGGEGGRNPAGSPSLQECGATCVACVTEVSRRPPPPLPRLLASLSRLPHPPAPPKEKRLHEKSGSEMIRVL